MIIDISCVTNSDVKRLVLSLVFATVYENNSGNFVNEQGET